MRPLVLLTLVAGLLGADTAQARLFWQSYGSVVPANGCGECCTWNSNQDYFVPRHCSSGRYGLFSPCKTSCTTSPACHWSHPLYPGYCGIYGPCHYGRRDHVYHGHCGCGCGCGLVQPYYGCYSPMLQPGNTLPNVERSKFQVLGSLPVPGDELLASLDMGAAANTNTDANEEALPGVLLPRVTPVEPTLPSLGRPPTENPSQ